ncbi:MAG: hypothetical protein GYB32_08840 [Algicola sp.]|nr:hypothetical protein [Algicola sp.]
MILKFRSHLNHHIMIATKVLGITSALTKSKKAKLAILGLEMAVLVYAIARQKAQNKATKRLQS